MSAVFYIAAASAQIEGGVYRYEMREHAAPRQLGFTSMTGVNYLAFSPDHQYLYSTCTIDGEGGVASYRIGDNGALELIGRMPSGGRSACYVATDPTGKFLYCANYSSGNFAEFRLVDGRITERTRLIQHEGKGPNPTRQEAAHTHFTSMTPDGNYLIVIDLGIDAVKTYAVDPETGIDPARVKTLHVTPGSGPRHLAFDRSGKLAYLANELGNSVTSLSYCDGEFKVIATADTLPEYWEGETKVAAIRLSRDERYLFVSNRGFDSIAVYQLDGKGGMKMTDLELTGGSSPRDINFLPGYRWFGATNEFSDQVMFYDYDGNGKLTPNGFTLTLPRPLHIFW